MAILCQSCAAELQTWTGKCPHCGGISSVELKAREDPLIGKIVSGRYRVTRRLGQGGMGAVYLAEHTGVGQKVAIKFLNPSFSDDPEVVRRFLNEARSYGQISHPHAVQLHDFGQDDEGNLFISMEYIEGIDLKRTLDQVKRLPLKDALDVVLQVCDVLGHAHSKGIVHRDLKPENIMLVRGLRGFHAKVLDFGVARLMVEQGTRLTTAGSICGTPRYMSPEQAQGQDTDERTDVYALGLVLVETITGRHPFEAQTVAETLRMQVSDPMPPVAQLAPDMALPAGLDAVVQKATAKRPEDRFVSMNAFAQALVPLHETAARAPAPVPESADRTMVRGSAEKTAHQASPFDRPKPPPKRVKLWAGIGAGVVAVGAAAVILATRSDKPAVAGWDELNRATASEALDAGASPVETAAPRAPPAEARPAHSAAPAVVAAPHPVAPPSTNASEASSVRLLAEGGMHNQALNEFTAGRLASAMEMLQRIPADSPVRPKADALKREIEELSGLVKKAESLHREGRCREALPLFEQIAKRNARIPGVSDGIRACQQGMRPEVID